MSSSALGASEDHDDVGYLVPTSLRAATTAKNSTPLGLRLWIEMAVNISIAEAFGEANARHPQLAQTWVTVSFRIGRLLPHSLLLASVQREGQLDLVLRCLEDECASQVAEGKEFENVLLFHHLNMLTSYWVGAMYETFRLLKSRELGDISSVAFTEIFDQLELVRVGLDKHEIAKERDLSQPLKLIAMPANDDATDYFIYDKEDQTRAHIMPMGMSARGSIVWQVIHLRKNSSYCVERRSLSDRILELWNQ